LAGEAAQRQNEGYTFPRRRKKRSRPLFSVDSPEVSSIITLLRPIFLDVQGRRCFTKGASVHDQYHSKHPEEVTLYPFTAEADRAKPDWVWLFLFPSRDKGV